jgi:hypothetical protein
MKRREPIRNRKTDITEPHEFATEAITMRRIAFIKSCLLYSLLALGAGGRGALARDNPPPSESTGMSAARQTFVWDWKEGPGSAASLGRDGNWGQKWMRFPAAWNFDDVIERKRPAVKVNVGILDIGIAFHEDLEFELARGTQLVPDDHGTHVTGIVAAKFENFVGVNGGTKYAHVVVTSLRRTSAPGAKFDLTFSEIISSLVQLIEEHRELKVINIGLGYNWSGNFRIDPERDEHAKETVAAMGGIARAVADLAANRKILLICAAGNDSRAQTTCDAQWGSPFNWAAKNKGGASEPAGNVIIVESIGRDGRHSVFSNVGGHVSAPGEDILSTVAFDKLGQLRTDAYAVMSGTAMATAQVTAVVAQLYAYNPDLTPDRVVAILKKSARPAPDGSHAPTVDAFAAMLECYDGDRPLRDLADLDHSGRVDMADFEIFRAALHQIEGSSSGKKIDLNGDGKASDEENIWPRTDLNGSGKLSRDAKDRRPVKGRDCSDLELMMRVWEDPTVPAADLPGKL